MTVRSRRLFGPTKMPAGHTVLYTVPADRTLILRTVIVVSATGASSSRWWLLLNGSSGSEDAIDTGQFTVWERKVHEAWTVLQEGETLDFFATVANQVQVSAFGSLLDGDPA